MEATTRVVIPAQAGIQVAVDQVKMDPRFRGDDDFLCADAMPPFPLRRRHAAISFAPTPCRNWIPAFGGMTILCA
jgi:hypothetical protein